MLNKKIFFIFFFAFLIRLIALNQSLWLDEAVTANVVKNFRFTQIISGFSPNDFHPPLYYLFMKLWTNMFGYSEITLRIPSVLFSLGTGWVIYLICRLHKNFGKPKWSATFFLFNPLIIYYSQEARMYMMATFFLTVALFFFLRILNAEVLDPRRSLPSSFVGGGNDKLAVLFEIYICLAFLTFYGSIFLIIPMLLYLLFKKQYKYFIVSLFVFIVLLLLISPLLYKQLINSKIALASITNWSLVLGEANIKNLLLIPIKFAIGRISFYPKWLYWGIAGTWTGFVFFTIKTVFNKTVFYLLIFPLFLAFIVSFFTPMLQYFRFIYLIPLMSIILGVTELQSCNDRSKIVTRSILLFGFVTFSLIYLLLPQFHREDWKGLVNNLPKNRPVYMITASSDPVKYYNKHLKINELKSLSSLSKEIIVIPYATEVYGFDYKSLLIKIDYRLKKEVSFQEVTYEQWIKE